MAESIIKAQLKYKDSSLLTFNVTNYFGQVDLATNIGINKANIIAIQPIASSGWSTYVMNFVYDPSSGNINLNTNVATAPNIKARFRVLYI